MSNQTALLAAAFGDDPGRWPLPVATTPHERWLRAVAAGGQGRYAVAAADLASLGRQVRNGPMASLALSTQGSFLRQLGGHLEARRWDGRALALAASDPEATADALLGLAADALGMARYPASEALLERARAAVDGSSTPSRLPLRWHWVAAEFAMARGDGAEAVRHAERAVELAARQPSVRHRVKTQVVLAAALCSAGRVDEARSMAEDALSTTDTLGLIPLQWAAASLLADVASNRRQTDDLIAVRDTCAEVIRRAGGVWCR